MPETVRAWTTRAGLLALVVIAAQLLWRAVLLGHGYFSQDDFLVMASTKADGAWSMLDADYAGGFSPAGTALVAACVGLAPLSWPLAAGVVLTLQTAATATMWLVLTRLLGDRWLRLPLLVMFAFSTLTLWSTQWWVLGLAYWSATLMLLVAVWAVLSATDENRVRRSGLALAAFALAVLFDERAVLFPVVLVGVALIAAGGDTVRARFRTAARDFSALGVGLLIVLAGYAVLRWRAAPLDLDLGNDLGQVVTGYLRHSLAEVFNGPWSGSLPAHAYLVPVSWIVALNGALLLGLVGLTTQHGRASARAAWGTLVVFVAGSVGVLALTGRADVLGSLGLVHRFGAELAAVVVIAAAGALREVEFPDLSARGSFFSPLGLERGASAVACVALVVSAAISAGFLASNLYHSDDREYVEAIRSGLRADPKVVLLDGGVPVGVISAWYGERATVRNVVGYAPERPVFDLPSHALRMVREDGSLAKVALEGPVRTKASDDEQCGYPVRSTGTLVPMEADVPDGRWVLRIGYYTSADGFADLDVAGGHQRFAVRSGLNAVDVVVNGGFTNFRMTLEDPTTTLCLTDASAGVPRPEPK
ncbi:hypothetical protein ABIE44_000249 [Marmoricola sp. OAE513]|uniref:hypothetical protein n=1 Tax=Marmoricola sp. OAE513 TaxID=2817894 RepID=UPI001AE4B8C4